MRGLGLAGGRQGADRECPAVKRKVAKAGLLIDGRVWVADGANKRPLGLPRGLQGTGLVRDCYGLPLPANADRIKRNVNRTHKARYPNTLNRGFTWLPPTL